MFAILTFPQYRKYTNNKHFFKIVSDTEFEEINFIGKKKITNTIVAKILPSRNFVFDLLNDVSVAEIISEEEYKQQLKNNTT